MRRELGQLSLADGVVEGGAGRNRQLERIAALVERSFAVLKRWYGYRRVRYRSLVKNALQLQLLAVALNLRRALALTG